MLKGLRHPSVPFLAAAAVALLLYKIMQDGFGLSSHAVCHFGLGGAALCGIFYCLTLLAPTARQK